MPESGPVDGQRAGVPKGGGLRMARLAERHMGNHKQGEKGRRFRSLVLAVRGVRYKALQEQPLTLILCLGKGSSEYLFESSAVSGGQELHLHGAARFLLRNHFWPEYPQTGGISLSRAGPASAFYCRLSGLLLPLQKGYFLPVTWY